MLFDNGLYRPEGALIPTGSLYTAGPYQVGECFPRGSAGDYFLVYRLNYERRSRAPEVSGGLSRTEAQRGGRFLLGRTTKHGSTFVSPCLIPQRGNKVAQWSASSLSTPRADCVHQPPEESQECFQPALCDSERSNAAFP